GEASEDHAVGNAATGFSKTFRPSGCPALSDVVAQCVLAGGGGCYCYCCAGDLRVPGQGAFRGCSSVFRPPCAPETSSGDSSWLDISGDYLRASGKAERGEL